MWFQGHKINHYTTEHVFLPSFPSCLFLLNVHYINSTLVHSYCEKYKTKAKVHFILTSTPVQISSAEVLTTVCLMGILLDPFFFAYIQIYIVYTCT